MRGRICGRVERHGLEDAQFRLLGVLELHVEKIIAAAPDQVDAVGALLLVDGVAAGVEEADDVVTRGADESAVEGNAVDRGLELGAAGERLTHQRLPGPPPFGSRRGLAVHHDAVPMDLERERRAEADKGVSGQALSALHALQQKARLERLELQVGRYRRIQVGGYVEGRFHFSAQLYLWT